MKVIVAGCRDFLDKCFVEQTIQDAGLSISELVSGGAPGVDNLGQWYAYNNNIPCRVFPADWQAHGRAAGPIRNTAMSNYADALILIWDGVSHGSRDMLQKMLSLKKPVFVRCFRRKTDAL